MEVKRYSTLEHVCCRAILEEWETGIFYDPEAREEPITVCPACQIALAKDDLDLSKQAKQALGKIYRRLLALNSQQEGGDSTTGTGGGS